MTPPTTTPNLGEYARHDDMNYLLRTTSTSRLRDLAAKPARGGRHVRALRRQPERLALSRTAAPVGRGPRAHRGRAAGADPRRAAVRVELRPNLYVADRPSSGRDVDLLYAGARTAGGNPLARSAGEAATSRPIPVPPPLGDRSPGADEQRAGFRSPPARRSKRGPQAVHDAVTSSSDRASRRQGARRKGEALRAS